MRRWEIQNIALKLKGKDRGVLGVDERIILKWM
jgi:hypothetical protein